MKLTGISSHAISFINVRVGYQPLIFQCNSVTTCTKTICKAKNIILEKLKPYEKPSQELHLPASSFKVARQCIEK